MVDDPGRKAAFGERMKDWFRRRLPIFWDNWVAATGSIVTVAAVFLLNMLSRLYVYNAVAGHESNPYVDLIGFLVVPPSLLLGIALVLVGMGLFSYEAYHYTDSNRFCSTVYHEVMAPEAATHASSPHANVHCVDCHIGPGAAWFVRAKLSGMRQVLAVLTDDFHRPIPSPVENLRPARETCQICHWPKAFHGSRLIAHQRFVGGRDNTATTTALVLHIGGPEAPGEGKAATGIH